MKFQTLLVHFNFEKELHKSWYDYYFDSKLTTFKNEKITIKDLLLIDQLKYDAVFIYLDATSLEKIHFIESIHSNLTSSKIVLVTDHTILSPDLISTLMSIGIHAFLHIKDHFFKVDEILSILKRGNKFISPSLIDNLFSKNISNLIDVKLNTKEILVLEFLSHGNSYKETAEELNLSVDGLRYHIKNLYRKLVVTNKTDAIITGMHLKYIKMPYDYADYIKLAKGSKLRLVN